MSFRTMAGKAGIHYQHKMSAMLGGRLVLRYIALATGTLFTLFCLFSSSSNSSNSNDSPSILSFFSSSKGLAGTGQCPPEGFSSGQWHWKEPPTNLTQMTAQEQAPAFFGIQACASSREYYWHMGSDNKDHWHRFPAMASWEWVLDQTRCDIRPFDVAALLRHLVEDGAWLLVGDSTSESHFFAISCMLYPHVRATPFYAPGEWWDRAWPQHLYLREDSPIVPHLQLPKGFSFDETPLLSFRRVDLLFDREGIIELYNAQYQPPADFDLFGKEETFTLPLKEYLDQFNAPLPKGNYGTMVVSTAGHWTVTVFEGFKDDSLVKEGYGIERVISLFDKVVQSWAKTIQDDISSRRRADPDEKERKVVVRAYLTGHDHCHNIKKPYKDVQPYDHTIFNWNWIYKFNDVFKHLLSSDEFPDMHYLEIDRPGRLRPDAHTTSDCLHIVAGPGTMEGWTHYIWHFLTREIPALEGKDWQIEESLREGRRLPKCTGYWCSPS